MTEVDQELKSEPERPIPKIPPPFYYACDFDCKTCTFIDCMYLDRKPVN